MNPALLMSSLFKSIPYLSILILNLLWIYLTLNHRVNKTRKTFEKQLVAQGMSKEDAEGFSGCFEELKDNIAGVVKQGIFQGAFRS